MRFNSCLAIALLSLLHACTERTAADAQNMNDPENPAIVQLSGHYDEEDEIWVTNEKTYITSSFEDGNMYAGVSRVDAIGNNLGTGLINKRGQIVVPAKYHGLSVGFTNGVCKVVNHDDKWGLVNEMGVEIVTPEYDIIGDEATDSLLFVRKGELTGFINLKGEVVIPVKYPGAEIAGEGMIAIMSAHQKWGYINYQDEVIVEPQFSHPGMFKDGKVVLQKEGGEAFTVYKDGRIEKNDVIFP